MKVDYAVENDVLRRFCMFCMAVRSQGTFIFKNIGNNRQILLKAQRKEGFMILKDAWYVISRQTGDKYISTLVNLFHFHLDAGDL